MSLHGIDSKIVHWHGADPGFNVFCDKTCDNFNRYFACILINYQSFND